MIQVEQLLEKKVVSESIKIIKNKNDVLPIKVNKNTRIAHVILNNELANYYQFMVLENISNELRKYCKFVDDLKDPGPGKLLEIVRKQQYDYIIVSVLNSTSYGINSVKLCGKIARNMMNGWTKYNTPCIFISYFDPNFIDSFDPIIDTMINTYGISKYTADELIKRIIQK